MKFISRNSTSYLLLVVLISSLIAACQPNTSAQKDEVQLAEITPMNAISATNTPTITRTPAPTPKPTISPLEARITELAKLESLCVIPEESGMAKFAREILSNYGYQVRDNEEDCQAILRVDQEVEALSRTYKNAQGNDTQVCYTGARVKTTITLEIGGNQRVSSSDDFTRQPPGVISKCPTESQAPAGDILRNTLVNNLAEVFGPLPIIAAIQNEIQGMDVDDVNAVMIQYTDPSAAYAVPELIEALKDDKAEVRKAAVWALRRIGPAAIEATSQLIQLLEDPDPFVSTLAAEALAEIASRQPQAIPPLIKALQSTEFRFRRAAAEALGEFGPAASEAVPELLNLLEHENAVMRRAAAISIIKIGGGEIEKVLPVLIEGINDDLFPVREDVYRALQLLGAQAMPAVPALIEAIDSETDLEEELLTTLITITGMNLTSQQEWQNWWDSR